MKITYLVQATTPEEHKINTEATLALEKAGFTVVIGKRPRRQIND